MPELPEVETIKRELYENILNKKIVSVDILHEKTYKNPHNINVKGQIEFIERIGKYLIIHIKNNSTMIIHLRMTGKLVFTQKESQPLTSSCTFSNNASFYYTEKHIQVLFYLDSDEVLIFHDVRKFGQIEVLPYKTDIKMIKNIGVDALSTDFTAAYLGKCVDKKATPIKNLLLNQKLIAGIGNIYSQEILFDSRISPKRLGFNIKKSELQTIHTAIINILSLAIRYNGTSISDFRRIDDKKGEFQTMLKVYKKEVCCICKNRLEKIKQAGRTTTYCDQCQL